MYHTRIEITPIITTANKPTAILFWISRLLIPRKILRAVSNVPETSPTCYKKSAVGDYGVSVPASAAGGRRGTHITPDSIHLVSILFEITQGVSPYVYSLLHPSVSILQNAGAAPQLFCSLRRSVPGALTLVIL